jgi:hypothetical protein
MDDFFNAVVSWQQPLLERIHLYSHAFPNASQPLDSTHVESLAKVMLVTSGE